MTTSTAVTPLRSRRALMCPPVRPLRYECATDRSRADRPAAEQFDHLQSGRTENDDEQRGQYQKCHGDRHLERGGRRLAFRVLLALDAERLAVHTKHLAHARTQALALNHVLDQDPELFDAGPRVGRPECLLACDAGV